MNANRKWDRLSRDTEGQKETNELLTTTGLIKEIKEDQSSFQRSLTPMEVAIQLRENIFGDNKTFFYDKIMCIESI